ncbi:MAG: 2Fe-2S iron-sulfur cluster binding domain-containing protein [Acidobacteria bacterium]|nr:2Fe-2S iron-sulfur cluster binding domain-containing protein [Acidobacteriota bacterium]
MDKVTVTINGRSFEARPGQSVLQTALENGIHIPHYCFHPGLPVAGNCRMCLVEIEGVPKLQIACGTTVRDGMVIRSDNDRVRQAVRHVLEFLLINHPVDCPVCDQAGECGLQEYYMLVGRYDSRFAENKVVKHKKASPIGRWVMLDQERCILCSRCVRFTREITKTNEMAIFNRGDHAEIDVFPGGELHNRYSANIVDICPVGALTCRDFRFRCRVWYLKQAPSVCPGCARGCNIAIHFNPERPHHAGGRRVLRFKPRPNPHVNAFWLCDDGRYSYPFIDDHRLRFAALREEGGVRQLYLRDALDRLADWLRSSHAGRTAYLLSADASNEELFAARKLLRDALGVRCLLPDTGLRTGDADDFLICEDKHPNSRGARILFGLGESDPVSPERLEAVLGAEPPELLLVNRADLPGPLRDKILAAGTRLVFLGTNDNATAAAAHLVVPLAVFAEQAGTFTNIEGRVQKFELAVPPLGDAAPEWSVHQGLAERLSVDLAFPGPAAIFRQLAAEVDAFRGLSHESLTPHGAMIRHE